MGLVVLVDLDWLTLGGRVVRLALKGVETLEGWVFRGRSVQIRHHKPGSSVLLLLLGLAEEFTDGRALARTSGLVMAVVHIAVLLRQVVKALVLLVTHIRVLVRKSDRIPVR